MDEKAGELSRFSFERPVVSDPYVDACFLVVGLFFVNGGLGGGAAWVAGFPLELMRITSDGAEGGLNRFSTVYIRKLPVPYPELHSAI